MKIFHSIKSIQQFAVSFFVQTDSKGINRKITPFLIIFKSPIFYNRFSAVLAIGFLSCSYKFKINPFIIKHEKQTLTDVVEARAKATSVNVDPTKLTPEAIQQFQQAQGGLSSALSRLMVVVEKYPDLKANENFLNLQAQLEGTENRITVERQKFNSTAQTYNTYIRKFPQNFIASFKSFEKKAYFEAEKGSEKAPKVQF